MEHEWIRFEDSSKGWRGQACTLCATVQPDDEIGVQAIYIAPCGATRGKFWIQWVEHNVALDIREKALRMAEFDEIANQADSTPIAWYSGLDMRMNDGLHL
jgi:hypothetical protein